MWDVVAANGGSEAAKGKISRDFSSHKDTEMVIWKAL